MRRIAYWISTAVVAVMLLMALSYLTGSEQIVSGFAKSGYPQHLRIVLGIAKPAAAIVLLLPGFALLKEWAYAGATFCVGDGVHLRVLWPRGGANLEPAARPAFTSSRLLRNAAREPPLRCRPSV